MLVKCKVDQARHSSTRHPSTRRPSTRHPSTTQAPKTNHADPQHNTERRRGPFPLGSNTAVENACKGEINLPHALGNSWGPEINCSENKPKPLERDRKSSGDVAHSLNCSSGNGDETEQLARVIADLLRHRKRQDSNCQTQSTQHYPRQTHQEKQGADNRGNRVFQIHGNAAVEERGEMKKSEMLRLIHETVKSQMSSLVNIVPKTAPSLDPNGTKETIERTDICTSSWSDPTLDAHKVHKDGIQTVKHSGVLRSTDLKKPLPPKTTHRDFKTSGNVFEESNLQNKSEHQKAKGKTRDILAMKAPLTLTTTDNAVRFSLCHKTKGDQEMKCVKLSLTQNGGEETDIIVEPDSFHQDFSPIINAKNGIVKVVYGSDERVTNQSSDSTSRVKKPRKDLKLDIQQPSVETAGVDTDIDASRQDTGDARSKSQRGHKERKDVNDNLTKCKDFSCFIKEQLTSKRIKSDHRKTRRCKTSSKRKSADRFCHKHGDSAFCRNDGEDRVSGAHLFRKDAGDQWSVCSEKTVNFSQTDNTESRKSLRQPELTLLPKQRVNVERRDARRDGRRDDRRDYTRGDRRDDTRDTSDSSGVRQDVCDRATSDVCRHTLRQNTSGRRDVSLLSELTSDTSEYLSLIEDISPERSKMAKLFEKLMHRVSRDKMEQRENLLCQSQPPEYGSQKAARRKSEPTGLRTNIRDGGQQLDQDTKVVTEERGSHQTNMKGLKDGSSPMLDASSKGESKHTENIAILESLNRLHNRLDLISGLDNHEPMANIQEKGNSSRQMHGADSHTPVIKTQERGTDCSNIDNNFATSNSLQIKDSCNAQSRCLTQNTGQEQLRNQTTQNLEMHDAMRWDDDHIQSQAKQTIQQAHHVVPMHDYLNQTAKHLPFNPDKADFSLPKKETVDKKQFEGRRSEIKREVHTFLANKMSRSSHTGEFFKTRDLISRPTNSEDRLSYPDKGNFVKKIGLENDHSISLKTNSSPSLSALTGYKPRLTLKEDSVRLGKSPLRNEITRRYDRGIFDIPVSPSRGPNLEEFSLTGFDSGDDKRRNISPYLNETRFETPTRPFPSRYISKFDRDTDVSPASLANKRLEKPSFYSQITRRIQEARNAREQRTGFLRNNVEDLASELSNIPKLKYPSHYEPFFHRRTMDSKQIFKADHMGLNDKPTHDYPRRGHRLPESIPNQTPLSGRSIIEMSNNLHSRMSSWTTRQDNPIGLKVKGEKDTDLGARSIEASQPLFTENPSSFPTDRLEELRNMQVPPTPSSRASECQVLPSMEAKSWSSNKRADCAVPTEGGAERGPDNCPTQEASMSSQTLRVEGDKSGPTVATSASQTNPFLQPDNRGQSVYISPSRTLSPSRALSPTSSKGILVSPQRTKERIRSPGRKVSFANAVNSVSSDNSQPNPANDAPVTSQVQTQVREFPRLPACSMFNSQLHNTPNDLSSYKYPSSYSEMRYQTSAAREQVLNTPPPPGHGRNDPLLFSGVRDMFRRPHLGNQLDSQLQSQQQIRPPTPQPRQIKPDAGQQEKQEGTNDDWDATVISRLQMRSTIPLAANISSTHKRSVPAFSQHRGR